jgi:hypothetical protein
VPTSLLIAPGLRTIQFLFFFPFTFLLLHHRTFSTIAPLFLFGFFQVWQNFWQQLFDNFLTLFDHFLTIFLTTFLQLFDSFLTAFHNFFDFFISIVLASCDNKYYGTNFIYAVPTSLPIAPGLRTIQFLFTWTEAGSRH